MQDDDGSLQVDSQPKSLGGRLSLHSSNEPSELSQWPSHDYSTMNIVFGIVTTTTTFR